MTEETKAVETETATDETTQANKATSVNLSTFYGVKAGMTRIFDKDGNHVPVTVVKLIPNVITQVKTTQNDGYEAYQLGYGEKREKLVNKPTLGRLSKANSTHKVTRFSEVKVNGVDPANLGKELSYEVFTPSTYVDVTGISKGKGFQGVIKRYNFAGGPAAHGSKFHRTTGSIGNRATPGKVFKNKKMPGHMGAKRETVQNLQVIEVNETNGYMLIKGSLPGSKNGFVRIATAVKK